MLHTGQHFSSILRNFLRGDSEASEEQPLHAVVDCCRLVCSHRKCRQQYLNNEMSTCREMNVGEYSAATGRAGPVFSCSTAFTTPFTADGSTASVQSIQFTFIFKLIIHLEKLASLAGTNGWCWQSFHALPICCSAVLDLTRNLLEKEARVCCRC